MNNIKLILYATEVFIFCIGAFSCKKIIQIDQPKDQLTTKKVFSDSTSATAALLNCYALLDQTVDPNLNKYLGLYTDELNYTGSNQAMLEFLSGSVSPSNSIVLNTWKNYYRIIYQCNDLMENIDNSSAISPSLIKQLTAEARFLRAFSYFYLHNLFGNIPLILTTDVNRNRLATQADSSVVYTQIIQDLIYARDNLPEFYRGSGKVRANKWAATAMLAKVYLYQHEWHNAETETSAVINSGLYTPLEAPGKVFLANAKGAIFQIWTRNGYIHDAPTLIPSDNSSVSQVPIVTDRLLSSFEHGDLRGSQWLKAATVQSGNTAYTYLYLYKYQNRDNNTSEPEYLMVLRIAEQYLIRAEARAKQRNISNAQSDLNIVRVRAGLPPVTINTLPALLDTIMHERQTELFCEWGNRFFDLKRAGKLNTALGEYKKSWKKDISVDLPIPQNEITQDPNLKQNIGYD